MVHDSDRMQLSVLGFCLTSFHAVSKSLASKLFIQENYQNMVMSKKKRGPYSASSVAYWEGGKPWQKEALFLKSIEQPCSGMRVM